ncbi:MAG: hypothetical protein QF492_07195 [Candidatus Krumholzibacteria bacterium]|jgi:hypothetical protein|nr:hypothetical protein [Candidatus Krumholzibacteria bacterium]MDP6669671.1 hypothetical protein [Candidatus Krumholzibacteria bacterium]MDP6797563.1 hypothetical protein [Candidatus Krumholzibacteria bacterium]MDP7021238.1 hypothetical protein [Candidatus Krumholzibacteria bacterium]
MHLDLLVSLKTVDLVCETAAMALRDTLSWGDRLLGLRRRDLWRFEGDAESESIFREKLQREVARTGVFVNTTKHQAVFQDGLLLGSGEPLNSDTLLAPSQLEGEGHWKARIWITDEGGEQERLRKPGSERIHPARLTSLKKGVLWEIRIRCESREQALSALVGMARSRSRERGLFYNPHYQEARLFSLKKEGSSDA